MKPEDRNKMVILILTLLLGTIIIGCSEDTVLKQSSTPKQKIESNPLMYLSLSYETSTSSGKTSLTLTFKNNNQYNILEFYIRSVGLVDSNGNQYLIYEPKFGLSEKIRLYPNGKESRTFEYNGELPEGTLYVEVSSPKNITHSYIRTLKLSYKPNIKTIKVFYYHSPTCPSCTKVKPYMDELKKCEGIEFDFCDVTNFNSCSEDSQQLIKNVNPIGVPFVVVQVKEDDEVMDQKTYVGWKNITEVGDYLAKLGIQIPKICLAGDCRSIQECVNCHNQRGLAPPSTFSCSYCCHRQIR